MPFIVTSNPAPSDSDLPRRAGAGAGADERSLIERIRHGDPLAFERLFRAYYPALCSFAKRLVGAETAEDVVQDVFRRIWERRERWTVDTTVAAYLYRAVRNGILDYRKHERVAARWEEATIEVAAHGEATAAFGADQRLYAAELTAAVEAAAAVLPQRCRQVFLLKWTHGLTYVEIAAVMDISLKTVEMQMTRAYRSLRERLKVFLP